MKQFDASDKYLVFNLANNKPVETAHSEASAKVAVSWLNAHAERCMEEKVGARRKYGFGENPEFRSLYGRVV
jgi:hypothetical protein